MSCHQEGPSEVTLIGFPKPFQAPQLAEVDRKWNSFALSYSKLTWAEAVVIVVKSELGRHQCLKMGLRLFP